MQIRAVAYLNQEGAALLAAGDLDTAITIFSHAIELLTQSRGFEAAPEIALAFWSKSLPFDAQTPSVSRRCSHSQQARDLLVDSSKDDGSYFVYSNPLVFHSDIAMAADSAVNCASVVLFNMALAWHQRGRLADSRALLRARILYDMSLQMVAKMSSNYNCANVTVAAINNKAHIHFECSDVGNAKTTLYDLLALLSQKNCKPPFEELEIEKFYMNILFLNATTMAGAA